MVRHRREVPEATSNATAPAGMCRPRMSIARVTGACTSAFAANKEATETARPPIAANTNTGTPNGALATSLRSSPSGSPASARFRGWGRSERELRHRSEVCGGVVLLVASATCVYLGVFVEERIPVVAGEANFLGRNQESTSEAVNAWYAITLFGQAVGRNDVRDLGRALFRRAGGRFLGLRRGV